MRKKEKAYFQTILEKVRHERQAGITVYPPERDVFNAFRTTEFGNVKVVILGQDPYHGAGQAHGLAFSVQPEIAVPPSLVNIYKELATDIEAFRFRNTAICSIGRNRGVLLLNTVLTVRAGSAHSHATFGWEAFTDEVIRQLDKEREHLVFMLWGSHAQKKGAFIDRKRHLVLTARHPSPLSAYRGFSAANIFRRQTLICRRMV